MQTYQDPYLARNRRVFSVLSDAIAGIVHNQTGVTVGSPGGDALIGIDEELEALAPQFNGLDQGDSDHQTSVALVQAFRRLHLRSIVAFLSSFDTSGRVSLGIDRHREQFVKLEAGLKTTDNFPLPEEVSGYSPAMLRIWDSFIWESPKSQYEAIGELDQRLSELVTPVQAEERLFYPFLSQGLGAIALLRELIRPTDASEVEVDVEQVFLYPLHPYDELPGLESPVGSKPRNVISDEEPAPAGNPS
jgi:hypothetical protein